MVYLQAKLPFSITAQADVNRPRRSRLPLTDMPKPQQDPARELVPHVAAAPPCCWRGITLQRPYREHNSTGILYVSSLPIEER